MKVREWTKADIEKIAVLEAECFSDPWTKEMLASSFEGRFFHGILIEEEGEILGYACQTVLFEDAEIEIVAVAPTERKKGLGKLLMESMEDIALALCAKQTFLEVRVSNVPAIALYTGFGFEKVRVRERYYADGEDALVMKKIIM